MKYLLDTMVVSEVVRPTPSPKVLEWLGRHPASDLAISVLTLGEVAKGVAAMAEGRRKRELTEWLAEGLPALFQGRVVPVDQDCALQWGQLAAKRNRLPVVDGLLLASAASHRLVLVSRNVRDTAGLGVPVVDPWTHETHLAAVR